MIPRLVPGEKITPAKLNQVIDALNAVAPARSSIPQEQTTSGTSVSVLRRPRDFYAIIEESPDRPRDLNGEVPDGEYEWAEVRLSAKEGFQEFPGSLNSYYQVSTGFLFNPAYEMNDDRKVETGIIVRMRPVEPIQEDDIVALDDAGNPILDDDGNPIIEKKGRGFLRRYVFSLSVGAVIKVVEIQPDECRRYGTVNHMGVFDGKTVNIDPDQGGDLREGDWSHDAQCWVLSLRETVESMTKITYAPGGVTGTFIPGEKVEQEGSGAKGWFFEDNGVDTIWIHTDMSSPDFDAEGLIKGLSSEAVCVPDTVSVPQSTIDEEKVNLLPSYTHFKGLLVGVLDFDGDERPLYVIDEGPIIRQFEIPEDAEDFVQNADETWPLYFDAQFVDQPEAPAVRMYRGSELDNDAASAHYPGIGRKAWEDHHGSVGFARWSRATKRWELLEAYFKTIALAKTKDIFGPDARGTVEIWWKNPVLPPAPPDPWTGAIASGNELEAFNFKYERIHTGVEVVVAFDAQENLWMIIDLVYPVMVDGVAGGPDIISEVGKLIFDDTDPGAVGAYLGVTNPGGDRHIVKVAAGTKGVSVANLNMATVSFMSFSNGLLESYS